MSVGDFVYGTCRRKIAKDSLTGLVKNQIKTFNVLIKVKVSFIFFNQFNINFVFKKFSFDADSDIIRVLGVNVGESEYIGLGAH